MTKFRRPHIHWEVSMLKLTTTAFALLLLSGAAYADSINSAAVGLNGNIGGPGGSHTLSIDGVTCTLKNSTQGPSDGCNYAISGEIDAQGKGTLKATPGNPMCTSSCK
jgi:hypothetical protein